MYKAFVFILFACIGLNASTQNLVSNPSFEEYYQCPLNSANVEDCKGVFNPNCANSGALSCYITPDYFNACAPSFSNANIPNTSQGYQQAKDGNAFIGIVNTLQYENDKTLSVDYREYAQIKLSYPLMKNHIYQFSFFANLANGFDINITTDQLGIKFVTDSVIYPNLPLWQIMQPDWVSNTYITDTAGWQKLEGSYIADGDEKWMIIGIFYQHEEFPYKLVKGALNLQGLFYIYLDDFEVKETPLNLRIPNVITANGDGVNDKFIVKGLPPNSKISIFNRWGNMVFTTEHAELDYWNGKYKNKNVTEGVYFYKLEVLTKTYSGFITVLR